MLQLATDLMEQSGLIEWPSINHDDDIDFWQDSRLYCNTSILQGRYPIQFCFPPTYQRFSNFFHTISFKLHLNKFECNLRLSHRPYFCAVKIALLMPGPRLHAAICRLIHVHALASKVCTPIHTRDRTDHRSDADARAALNSAARS